ncbi:DUF4355 domain-containing protein [Microbacterium sp. ZXX196]|uniref:DUF4355 domain-containing protein n=1 Tax=Microbacterium sp. ZXX196 TaxID=2609291 RepID=UPI0012B7238B|nr:DUF4355 domain-containing protein [Microbacterium sp. ZXX196]MTE24834.1 DUF4355 domain-containing protein [Microbacterium sp. ZXX196]
MSEQTAPTEGTEETHGQGAEGREFQAITSQEDFDKAIQSRIARERAKYADYDELKSAKTELDQIRESQKTESEKAAERLAAAEKRAADLEAAQAAKDLELVRLSIIAKHGIPEEDQILVHGSTEEELAASAERVAALASTHSQGPRPVPSVGKSPAKSTENVPIREQIAAAEAAGDAKLVSQLKAVMLGDLPTS